MKKNNKIQRDLIYVKKSKIHNKGVFANRRIPKKTRITRYLGEKITKKEGTYRENITILKSKASKKRAATYIFELDNNYDIDGDVPYNKAKFINHSCRPNCIVEIKNGNIWIIAKRNIKKQEEITINYGFSLNDLPFHTCKCGASNCPGYILDEKYWKKIVRTK